MSDVDWAGYLSTFHRQHPGITEDVLEHARDADGRTPYDWVAAAVPTDATVLDLACGSGPMSSRLTGRYVGLDLSAAELSAAASKGLAIARADATRLPLADQSVDAVVMSMALMLVPMPATLSEVRRVLRPGGVFVASVPHGSPLPRRDWLRYGRLCLALRHPGLSYPNDKLLKAAGGAFLAAGLSLAEDGKRAFVCHLESAALADQLLASLYLPDVSRHRLAAGRRVLRRWVGTGITTPIRRIVAYR